MNETVCFAGDYLYGESNALFIVYCAEMYAAIGSSAAFSFSFIINDCAFRLFRMMEMQALEKLFAF